MQLHRWMALLPQALACLIGSPLVLRGLRRIARASHASQGHDRPASISASMSIWTAIERGQLNTVRQLYAEGMSSCQNCSTIYSNLCSWAASKRQLPIQQMLQRQPTHTWKSSVCEHAASRVNLEVLKFAHENGCPGMRNVVPVLRSRATWRCSNLRTKMDAHGTSPPAGLLARCISWRSSNLHIALGAPGTRPLAWKAAKYGHLDILQWAHEHGCPWDERSSSKAAKHRHQDLLEWALDHGCPIAAKLQEKAALSRRDRCLADSNSTAGACQGNKENLAGPLSSSAAVRQACHEAATGRTAARARRKARAKDGTERVQSQQERAVGTGSARGGRKESRRGRIESSQCRGSSPAD